MGLFKSRSQIIIVDKIKQDDINNRKDNNITNITNRGQIGPSSQLYKPTDFSAIDDNLTKEEALSSNKFWVTFSDGTQLPVENLSDLKKFEVIQGTVVVIPPNRISVKCPFNCVEGYRGQKGPNILTFTQNIIQQSCCGVRYEKEH